MSDSHDKGKDIVTVFVDFLYNHFDDLGVITYIIWSDAPSSEFKNKFMVKFLKSLSQKHISLSHGNKSHGSTPFHGGKLSYFW